MSEEKKQILLSVFRQLKQRVLWKWEAEEMADKPDNVMLSKWLPQQERILRISALAEKAFGQIFILERTHFYLRQRTNFNTTLNYLYTIFSKTC
jgi:hypothetical protein